MKICSRAINWVQIYNTEGDVRLCGWQCDGGVIGRLTKNTIEEIYHSPAADLIRKRHFNHDYSNCNVNACPYIANNDFSEAEIDIDKVPDYPEELSLSYENICNYRCVTCVVPGWMDEADAVECEKKLNKIDEEVRKVLPYVKRISANGMGELFASKHILKLLAEWKPISPANEIHVSLESNGSLFNEENWKKIENLGQYDLSVTITVMSFEETAYQYLSGTKLPVSNIESNLRFVKSLREKGIINYLELATVYQERNFRTLPEFTRRCIEEFGADSVRLRPFEPWNQVGIKEWFMDVRNVYHPYHGEFLEVMKDPVFNHPKVHDWGGGRESGLGLMANERARIERDLMGIIYLDDSFPERLLKTVNGEQIIIYAMGVIGKTLIKALKDKFNIVYAIDRTPKTNEYEGIPIYSLNELSDKEKNVPILISLVDGTDGPEQTLLQAGYETEIYKIMDIIPNVR